MKEERLALALGWFSIGLGVAEVLAPRRVAKVMGLPNHSLLPFLGIREITSGIGILRQPHKPGWLWSRAVGDAMDLAVLGGSFASSRSQKVRLAAATAAVAGVTALDVLCGKQLTDCERDGRRPGVQRVRNAIVINRPAQQLYDFWRKLENLPRVMRHLKAVHVLDNRRSHWIADAPGGAAVEWDAEIVEDIPGQMISWRSLPGADVENAGRVRFESAAGGRGTIVRIEMEYKPPGGGFGASVAKLFGKSAQQQVPDALRPFKQLMETGEIATTEGQPAGRKTSTSHRYDHVARQLAEA